MELVMAHIKYFWDDLEDNVVREYDQNNNTLATYTTEPTRYGSVLSQDRAGEKRYFQFDGQGNTTELTDPSGDVTETRRYSAFGDTTVSTGATSTPFGFGGRWGYHSSGAAPAVNIRRRDYDHHNMRWLSIDPSPLYTGSNYQFVTNAPLTRVDPAGLRDGPTHLAQWPDWLGSIINEWFAPHFPTDVGPGKSGPCEIRIAAGHNLPPQ